MLLLLLLLLLHQTDAGGAGRGDGHAVRHRRRRRRRHRRHRRHGGHRVVTADEVLRHHAVAEAGHRVHAVERRTVNDRQRN